MNDQTQTSFDPNEFMQQQIDTPTEGLQTEYKLPPEGEYTATIDNFDGTAFERIDFMYKRGPSAGLPGSMTKFNCPFVILDDPKIKEALGVDRITVRKVCMLDFDDRNQLDFGTNRNLDLNRIRVAAKQDAPGPWSFPSLRGAGPMRIKVVHREVERKDKTKVKVAEVSNVVAIT